MEEESVPSRNCLGFSTSLACRQPVLRGVPCGARRTMCVMKPANRWLSSPEAWRCPKTWRAARCEKGTVRRELMRMALRPGGRAGAVARLLGQRRPFCKTLAAMRVGLSPWSACRGCSPLWCYLAAQSPSAMFHRMSIPPGPREGALPIAEAARRLGVSTLRVRQYVAEGRLDAIRDNRGRLRVDLGPHGPRPPRSAAVSPVELLMEELIDLREDSAEREVQVERLEGLVGELSGLLGRALDALAAAKDEAAEDRAQALALGEQTSRALALAARAMDAATRGRG